ncbi:hypothetical protein Dda_6390 [Drechslerella dactyloides]|uniref:Uncharacterized protein n=1 Tax=Drechslerella dactyloides TaxID=74499 RepID=A0AAD6ITG6_DREDA|nr:hypothetical protein Dda_6390 [Drechslerella dactyloides]
MKTFGILCVAALFSFAQTAPISETLGVTPVKARGLQGPNNEISQFDKRALPSGWSMRLNLGEYTIDAPPTTSTCNGYMTVILNLASRLDCIAACNEANNRERNYYPVNTKVKACNVVDFFSVCENGVWHTECALHGTYYTDMAVRVTTNKNNGGKTNSGSIVYARDVEIGNKGWTSYSTHI